LYAFLQKQVFIFQKTCLFFYFFKKLVIPGWDVQTNKFCAAYPSFDPLKTRIVSPSQDEDDEHEEDDSMDSPAAGSSTSPAICATPTSVVKRPMSPAKQAASVKRPCVQALLSYFFTEKKNSVP
jgi:hypothetical protein